MYIIQGRSGHSHGAKNTVMGISRVCGERKEKGMENSHRTPVLPHETESDQSITQYPDLLVLFPLSLSQHWTSTGWPESSCRAAAKCPRAFWTRRDESRRSTKTFRRTGNTSVTPAPVSAFRAGAMRIASRWVRYMDSVAVKKRFIRARICWHVPSIANRGESNG